MPSKYVLASSNEFLDLIIATESSKGIIVFLDVESLFTSVSVKNTIRIFIDNVYGNVELVPPNIPQSLLMDM